MRSRLVKEITFNAIGIALYVVLGMTMKIPLIGHIGLDLGYVVFGCWLFLLGKSATVVGVIGCMLESLLISGWIPIGWMVGQTIIGLICGYCYFMNNGSRLFVPDRKAAIENMIITCFAILIGIGIVKTLIECALYNIPFEVKVVKNLVACAADSITMILGYKIGYTYYDTRLNKLRGMWGL